MHKSRVAAKYKAGYDDDSTEAPANYETRTRNQKERDGKKHTLFDPSNGLQQPLRSFEDICVANRGSKLRKPGLLQKNRRPQALKPYHEQPIVNKSLLGDELPVASDIDPEMLLQPDTRPISHEQLVREVKGIYAGLVMVEAKCIDIDERQSAAAQEKDSAKNINLKNDQWQSLIALHKHLLHEHRDFFLASQHPSASPALSRLAAKYSMPARMWRHGIHAFLEVLRHRLPDSLEHMLALIYIAYSMMALLYETVSAFEDTWIECLGDLARYRMAIEEDETIDREVWSNVARFWYNKAADKSPNVGRLYHHLAILARPYTLEQLSLYTRSLTCITPFESAKGSIMTLFNPILNGKESATRQSSSFEIIFIRAHGIFFTRGSLDSPDRVNAIFDELDADSLFEQYIVKAGARLTGIGVCAAVANLSALLDYGRGHSTKKLDFGFPKPVGIARRLLSAFTAVNIDENEWSYGLQPRIERMLRARHHIGTVSKYLHHTKYFSRVKEYEALIREGLRRKKLSLKVSLLVPLITSFLPVVGGSPIGTPDKADEPSSTAPSMLLVVGSLYVGFTAAALVIAHSLAARNGPIRVWGCMMGISAYGWWAVRNDVTASPSLSIADLGVWAISTLQYGNATFQEFKIPERMSLITLLAAAILDMAIVSFMTPSGAPISQSDLLSLSLPAMSLSLAITANVVGCFRHQPPPPPPSSHENDAEVSITRDDPYYGGHFQQLLAIPSSSASRHHLLGNPLNEDSARIWDNDG